MWVSYKAWLWLIVPSAIIVAISWFLRSEAAILISVFTLGASIGGFVQAHTKLKNTE